VSVPAQAGSSSTNSEAGPSFQKPPFIQTPPHRGRLQRKSGSPPATPPPRSGQSLGGSNGGGALRLPAAQGVTSPGSWLAAPPGVLSATVELRLPHQDTPDVPPEHGAQAVARFDESPAMPTW
jgi:hypothetical protein